MNNIAGSRSRHVEDESSARKNMKNYRICFMSLLTNPKHLAGIVLIAIFATSCRQPAQKVAFQGEAQGTYYSITYFDANGRNYQNAIDSLLSAFDQSLSLWVPGSIISRVNAGDTSVRADTLFSRVFRRSQQISQLSDGAFDVTVGPLVKAWGFSFKGKIKLDSVRVDSLKQLVGYHRVSLSNGRVLFDDPRMQVDFNAIAQGFSVDVIGEFLSSKGIENYLVDVGGEVLARGTKPNGDSWIVGIEKPADSADSPERKVETTLAVTDMAVATSGNYRKFYVENGIRYSHTIDPATGYPVRHNTLSVTVLAPDAMTADAMATVFMVMGSEKAMHFLKSHPEFQAWFIDAAPNGGYIHHWTPGMKTWIRESDSL